MTSAESSRIIMDAREINNVLDGFVAKVIAEYQDLDHIGIVGIQTGGAHLAKRFASRIEERTGKEVDLGILDITFYRDDIALEKEQPIVRETNLPFKISSKIIILVDDVLYTGRTVRAALDAIIDFGRPKAIRLAVIVDRGLREVPIRPDYLGQAISTTDTQKIHVNLTEEGFETDHICLEMGIDHCN